MTQSKLIKAYKAMESLALVDELTAKEQWEIYNVRKKIRPHYEFQIERENAIREKYAEYADGDGELVGDKAEEFINEINELLNMEVDMESDKKPQIRFVKGINFITAESLEDFIEFVPAE